MHDTSQYGLSKELGLPIIWHYLPSVLAYGRVEEKIVFEQSSLQQQFCLASVYPNSGIHHLTLPQPLFRLK